MFAAGVIPVADALTGPGRLQLIAVLLGLLVFGVVVLLVERRNSTNEAALRGRTGAGQPPAVTRQVYRAPATGLPVVSARDAAEASSADVPYPMPFLTPDSPPEAVPGPEQAGR